MNIEDWKKAGIIAGTARDYGCSLVKKGAKILDVANAIEQKIFDLGGELAFPVNISFDKVAAHDGAFPNDDRVFDKNVVKIDVGAHVNGAIGDTASTVDLTGEYKDLLQASRDALNAALEIVRPGAEIGKIGATIQEVITQKGFAPIRNLAGHGLKEYEVHASPSIPNTATGNKNTLKEGQIIAIEPFATTGDGLIQEAGIASIFSQASTNPVRDKFARKLLAEIKGFNNLPFSSRHLTGSYAQIRMGLLHLKRAGTVREHPPLVEVAGGMVSQAEHTMIVQDEPIFTTKI